MRIIVFGANGKIGKTLVSQLSPEHEVIKIGRSSGDIQADYTNEQSIIDMYDKIGSFDALCCVAGRDSKFVDVKSIKIKHFQYGIERKLLGQIRLVLEGLKYINDAGSFTLSSGYLSDYPNAFSMATSPFNAFVDNFTKSMSRFLQKNIRLNAVSPAPVVENAENGKVTAEMVAKEFIASIERNETGKVFKVWNMD